ncbi:hypothetical protein ThvES_00018510 [Thiovulum sp. ES]|nr:hypothetical protein ThvES_00018510 [Thiovulum sp. ES]
MRKLTLRAYEKNIARVLFFSKLRAEIPSLDIDFSRLNILHYLEKGETLYYYITEHEEQDNVNIYLIFEDIGYVEVYSEFENDPYLFKLLSKGYSVSTKLSMPRNLRKSFDTYSYTYISSTQLNLEGSENKSKRKAVRLLNELDIRYYTPKDIIPESIFNLLELWAKQKKEKGEELTEWYASFLNLFSESKDSVLIAIFDTEGRCIAYSITERISENAIVLTDGKIDFNLPRKYKSLFKAIQYLEAKHWESLIDTEFYMLSGSGESYLDRTDSSLFGVDLFKANQQPYMVSTNNFYEKKDNSFLTRSIGINKI